MRAWLGRFASVSGLPRHASRLRRRQRKLWPRDEISARTLTPDAMRVAALPGSRVPPPPGSMNLRIAGRVEMWRGGSRSGLSVAAPFVWRCPNNLAVAPFPHPAHRTGRAGLPHPALGQDACFRPRKVALCLTEQQQGPCVPCLQFSRPSSHNRRCDHLGRHPLPDQGPSPSFTSACDAGRGSRALAEFARVAPISSTSPLSTSALN